MTALSNKGIPNGMVTYTIK